MRKLYALACLFVIFSVPAFAQTGIPTSWTARIYVAGSPSITRVFIITRAQATCGQTLPPGPAPPVENPDMWVWDDPFQAGFVCWFGDAELGNLPDGNYEGTLAAVNGDGASVETTRVPFTRRRPNPPAVPTGLRMSRQG